MPKNTLVAPAIPASMRSTWNVIAQATPGVFVPQVATFFIQIGGLDWATHIGGERFRFSTL
jgi:hypothetical protein